MAGLKPLVSGRIYIRIFRSIERVISAKKIPFTTDSGTPIFLLIYSKMPFFDSIRGLVLKPLIINSDPLFFGKSGRWIEDSFVTF